MSEFPRLSIPGHPPLARWQIEANEIFENPIAREIDQWVMKMVRAEAARRDIILIGLLARNPWWLNLIAQSPRWQELRNRG